MQPDTDTSLTFEQMYREYWRYCRRVVTWRSHGLDEDTIDDLVSDAYESLYRNWYAVEHKPAKQQQAYLIRAVANRVNDYLRRLRLERATLVSEAQCEAPLTHSVSGDYDGDVDAISVHAYLASGRAESVDAPERIYLAREALREVLDACAFAHLDATATKRVQATMFADALGYNSVQIAHAQRRSESAIKMELMRARERLNIPKQVQRRASTKATAPRTTQQRRLSEVAA